METYQKVSLPLFLERKPWSLPVFRGKQLRVFTKPATWNTPLEYPPAVLCVTLSTTIHAAVLYITSPYWLHYHPCCPSCLLVM